MNRPTRNKTPSRPTREASKHATREETRPAFAKTRSKAPAKREPIAPEQEKPFRNKKTAEITPRPSVKASTTRRRNHADPDEKPERLQKLLAQSGLGSRRDMEALIAEGRVNVNGKTAELGQTAKSSDLIKVNGKLVAIKSADKLPRVILYHKPEGEIVSRDDPQHRPSVFNALPRLSGSRWIAVGRLDFNTSGLLLFTTSGELANCLMHPRYNLVREYAVRLLGGISDENRQMLLDGIELEDGPASFSAFIEAGGEGANRWYRVALSEGRNREVRRMFEAVGITVSRLIRVTYGPFALPPNLKRGKTVELDEKAVQKLLEDFGFEKSYAPHRQGTSRR